MLFKHCREWDWRPFFLVHQLACFSLFLSPIRYSSVSSFSCLERSFNSLQCAYFSRLWASFAVTNIMTHQFYTLWRVQTYQEYFSSRLECFAFGRQTSFFKSSFPCLGIYCKKCALLTPAALGKPVNRWPNGWQTAALFFGRWMNVRTFFSKPGSTLTRSFIVDFRAVCLIHSIGNLIVVFEFFNFNSEYLLLPIFQEVLTIRGYECNGLGHITREAGSLHCFPDTMWTLWYVLRLHPS